MADYDEIVSGTIDEVKEKIEEEDLELEKVLEAEKQNKDRVTLVEWLEERIDESRGEEPAETEEEEAGSSRSLLDYVTDRLFASGFLVGAVIVALAMFYAGPAMSQGMSPAEVGSHLETYFSQNTENMSLQGVAVNRVDKMEGSGLYRASITMKASIMNRTVTQNRTVVVTSDGRYVFLSPPIDTTSPLSEQVRTQ